MAEPSRENPAFPDASVSYGETLEHQNERERVMAPLPHGELSEEKIRGILETIERDRTLLDAREMFDWRMARAALKLNAMESRMQSPSCTKEEKEVLEKEKKIVVLRINNYERNLRILEWNAYLLREHRDVLLPEFTNARMRSELMSKEAEHAAAHLAALSDVLREMKKFKQVRLLFTRMQEEHAVPHSELKSALDALPSRVSGELDGRSMVIDLDDVKQKALTFSPEHALEEIRLRSAEDILSRKMEILLSFRSGVEGVTKDHVGENPLDVWFDQLLTDSLRSSLDEELRLGRERAQSESRDALMARQQKFRAFITEQRQQYTRNLVHHFVGDVAQLTTGMFKRTYAGDRPHPSSKPENIDALQDIRNDMTQDWEMDKQAIEKHKKALDDFFDLRITDELDRRLITEEVYQRLRFHGVIQTLDILARANALPKFVRNRLARLGMRQVLPDSVTDVVNPKVTLSEEAHKALEGLRKGWQLPDTVTFLRNGVTVTENFDPLRLEHWEAIPEEQWKKIEERTKTTLQVLGGHEREVRANFARVKEDSALIDTLWGIRHPLDLEGIKPDQALYDQLTRGDITVQECLADQERLKQNPKELAAVWITVIAEFHGHMDAYTESAGVTVGDLTHLADEKAKAHTGLMDMARDNQWGILTFLFLAWYARGVFLSWRHSRYLKAAVTWHLTGGAAMEMGKDVSRVVTATPRAARWAAGRIRTAQERSQAHWDIQEQRAPTVLRLQRIEMEQESLITRQRTIQRAIERLATGSQADALTRFEALNEQLRQVRAARLQSFTEEARVLDEQFRWTESKPLLTSRDLPLRRMARQDARRSVLSFQRRFNAFCEEMPEARRIVAGGILTGEPLEQGFWDALQRAHPTRGVARKMSEFMRDVPDAMRAERMRDADRLMRLGLAGETTADDVLRLDALNAARMSKFVASGAIALEVFVSAYMLLDNEQRLAAAVQEGDAAAVDVYRKRRQSLVASASGGVASGGMLLLPSLVRLSLPTAVATGVGTIVAEQLYERAETINVIDSQSPEQWPTSQIHAALAEMTRDGPWAQRWTHVFGDDAALRGTLVKSYIARTLRDSEESPGDRENAEKWFDSLSTKDRDSLIKKHGCAESAIVAHVYEELIPARNRSAVEQGRRLVDHATRTLNDREATFDVNRGGPERRLMLLTSAADCASMYALRQELHDRNQSLRFSYMSFGGRWDAVDLSRLPDTLPVTDTPDHWSIMAQVHDALAQFRRYRLWKMREQYLLAGEVRGAFFGSSQGWKDAASIIRPFIFRRLTPYILEAEYKIQNGVDLSDVGSGRNALLSFVPQTDLQKKVSLYELRRRLEEMAVHLMSVLLKPDCDLPLIEDVFERMQHALVRMDGRTLFDKAEAENQGSPRFNPLKHAIVTPLRPQGGSSVYEEKMVRVSAMEAGVRELERRLGGIPLDHCVSALLGM